MFSPQLYENLELTLLCWVDYIEQACDLLWEKLSRHINIL